MPSPFPGMNPYFEGGNWREFHTLFLTQMRFTLPRELRAFGERYRAVIEEDVVIREPSARERRAFVADAGVAVTGRGASPAPAGQATLAAPHYARRVEPRTETKRWLEIRTRDGGDRLVTHVELLSPTNKHQDRAAYVDKRERLMASRANFVEIDLLRGGGRMPMEDVPPCDYCVVVARPQEQPRLGIWAVGLREPLPTIPVPLLPGDGDVRLDLMALLHRLYDEAGFGLEPYQGRLYAKPPEPPLSAEDAAWAEGVLREAGVTPPARPVPVNT